MRLWHEQLLQHLPRQQLLGQHRECCALRGNGWQKKHATVDYIFGYSPYKLYQYHMLVMKEMQRRGYQNDVLWEHHLYRGKSCQPFDYLEEVPYENPIYPEHNEDYFQECVINLEEKGIYLYL